MEISHLEKGGLIPTYQPSVYYFRKGLREAGALGDVVGTMEIGLTLCRELELQQEYIRSLGHVPPHRFLMQSEILEKGLRQG